VAKKRTKYIHTIIHTYIHEQVFVGGEKGGRYIEDMNMYDGKYKSQVWAYIQRDMHVQICAYIYIYIHTHI
jgi:hypothetical protein